MPNPGKTLIHIHPGAEELGRIYTPTLAINATPGAFFDAIETIPTRADTGAAKTANVAYHTWTDNLPQPPGDVQMGEIMSHLRNTLADDAILTNGAGNYAIWLHRFWRFKKNTAPNWPQPLVQWLRPTCRHCGQIAPPKPRRDLLCR